VTELTSSLDSLASALLPAYPVPAPPQAQPGQEPGKPVRPSGPVPCAG
jgi:hypothetical protein